MHFGLTEHQKRSLLEHIVCEACSKHAVATLVMIRHDNGSVSSFGVCHDHLLDPGPLVDF